MKPEHHPFPPASPAAAESHALEAEWRGEPPSAAREDARRALHTLAKAAAETAGQKPEDATPPLPAGLRGQWQEAYGSPQPARPAPAPVRAKPQHPRLREWVAAAFSARGLAWGGGVCAAVLVLSLLLFNQGMPPSAGGDASGPVVTRGPGGDASFTDEGPAVVILVSPAEKTALKDAVLSSIGVAFPGRAVVPAATAAEAETQAASVARAVMLDLGSGLATAWAGGKRVADFSLAGMESRSEAVISIIEDADETLDEAAPQVP